MADDAESQDLALNVRCVDERELNEVSVPNTSGRRCWKKNRPPWFHSEDRSEDYSSSEAESSSSSEEDEAQSVIGSDDERSKNDAHVEIEGDGEGDAQKSSSSCPDESLDQRNTRKKKASLTKQRPPCFFALFSHANPPRNIHATREGKLSAVDWNILKVT